MRVGKLDDSFVFTHNNDVVTWTRGQGFERIEVGMDHLEDAAIFNDDVLVVGDGDEIGYIDGDEYHLIYDGQLSATVPTYNAGIVVYPPHAGAPSSAAVYLFNEGVSVDADYTLI